MRVFAAFAFVPGLTFFVVRLLGTNVRPRTGAFHLQYFDGAPGLHAAQGLHATQGPDAMLAFGLMLALALSVIFWIALAYRAFRNHERTERFFALTSEGILMGEDNTPERWRFHSHNDMREVQLAGASLVLHDEDAGKHEWDVAAFHLRQSDIKEIEQTRKRVRLGLSRT